MVAPVKITRVLVLGGGTAGLLSALTLKAQLPRLDIRIVRSREMGVIGVGEGSTVGLPSFLHGLLKIDPKAFFREAQPTWKLGLRFVRWGPRTHFHYSFSPSMHRRWQGLSKLAGFYCDEEMIWASHGIALMEADRVFLRQPDGSPRMAREVGYHLENKLFVDFLERQAEKCGIPLIDDTMTEVRQDEQGITGISLANGGDQTADLYVDCSGFGSALLGRTLDEKFRSFRTTLFCDRAVVGGWVRGEEPIKPYTSVETKAAGWCWQIEHEHRINSGYVYSSAFISDEEAEREFRARNPLVDSVRVVPFVSGRYERAWVKNVVAVGNACGFVEPLEATSLGAICSEAAHLMEILVDSGCEPSPSLVRLFNQRTAESWDNIRRFLGIHYRYNTALDTPFWRACRADTELAGAEPIVEFFEENGPSDLGRQALLSPFDQFTMDGWLTLLVGQRVPYRKQHVPSNLEAATWRKVNDQNRAQVKNAFTIPQGLAMVRSPAWRWNLEAFQLR